MAESFLALILSAGLAGCIASDFTVGEAQAEGSGDAGDSIIAEAGAEASADAALDDTRFDGGDSADSGSREAAAPDVVGESLATYGSVACGAGSCNGDPSKGPVQACCIPYAGGAPRCANTCSDGALHACDDRSDCAALGRPADHCCLAKNFPGGSFCRAACVDSTELP